MTNERAVEILNLDLDILGQYGDETAEAYKMAIKALEAQEQAIKEAYDKGYEYGVKDWFEKHTKSQTCIEEYPTCTECEHYDREKHYCPRFCQVIKDALAEAQPKKGKWVNVSPISYICSCCSYGVGRWNNTSYCPNCGAEMGGADETN